MSSARPKTVTLCVGAEVHSELRGILELGGAVLRQLLESAPESEDSSSGASIRLPPEVDSAGFALVSQWINSGVVDVREVGCNQLISAAVAAEALELRELRDICLALLWRELEWSKVESAFAQTRMLAAAKGEDATLDSVTTLLWKWTAKKKRTKKKKTDCGVVPKRSDEETKEERTDASGGYSQGIVSALFRDMNLKEVSHFLAGAFSPMREERVFELVLDWLRTAARAGGSVSEAWASLKSLIRFGAMKRKFLCTAVMESGLLSSDELLSVIRAQSLRDSSLTPFGMVQRSKELRATLGRMASYPFKAKWKRRVILPKDSRIRMLAAIIGDAEITEFRVDKSGRVLSGECLSPVSDSGTFAGYELSIALREGSNYWCSTPLGYGATAVACWCIFRVNTDRFEELEYVSVIELKFQASYTPATVTASFAPAPLDLDDEVKKDDSLATASAAESGDLTTVTKAGISKWTTIATHMGVTNASPLRFALDKIEDSDALSEPWLLLLEFAMPVNSYVGLENVNLFIETFE